MGRYGDFQFPLWWFHCPPSLKGWIDRVYACGLPTASASNASDRHWGDRWRRAPSAGNGRCLVVTAGGWAEQPTPRAVLGLLTISCFRSSTGCCFTPALASLPPLVFCHCTEKTRRQRFAPSPAGELANAGYPGKRANFPSAGKIMAATIWIPS